MPPIQADVSSLLPGCFENEDNNDKDDDTFESFNSRGDHYTDHFFLFSVFCFITRIIAEGEKTPTAVALHKYPIHQIHLPQRQQSVELFTEVRTQQHQDVTWQIHLDVRAGEAHQVTEVFHRSAKECQRHHANDVDEAELRDVKEGKVC
jgi:hypothetical protein